MNRKGLLAAAMCALITAMPAAATDNPFARDQAVLHLEGLDLTTVDGQQRLAIRMDEAARAVCGDRLASVHLALDARARECRATVLADIRTQIENRMASTGQASPTQLASIR